MTTTTTETIRETRYSGVEFTPEDLHQIYSLLRELGYRKVYRSRWTCESMTEWERGTEPEHIRIRVRPCGLVFLRDPGATLELNNWRWDTYQINNHGPSKWECVRQNFETPFRTPSDWAEREEERKAREAREDLYEARLEAGYYDNYDSVLPEEAYQEEY